MADPEKLKRVIFNIVNNAEKYMDHSPSTLHVIITEEPSKPEQPPLYRQLNKDGSEIEPALPPDEFIRIHIEDEGPGIAAASSNNFTAPMPLELHQQVEAVWDSPSSSRSFLHTAVKCGLKV